MTDAMQQDQFLNVIDRDEAERRFRAALELAPLATEIVSLDAALGRVLAEDIVAPTDVPGFDRANVDGFAVRAEDTFGASEEQPRRLHLNSETLTTGVLPRQAVAAAIRPHTRPCARRDGYRAPGNSGARWMTWDRSHRMTRWSWPRPKPAA